MNTEQQMNLKFGVGLGKNPSQALEILQQVYEDKCFSVVQEVQREARGDGR